MQSAFGVDHSEVSKAFPAITRKQKAKRDRNSAVRLRSAARRGKIQRVSGAIITAPGKAARKKVSVADVGSGVGRGTAKVGTLVGRYPVVTGTAVLGGAGYGAYKLSQPRKKRVAQ